MRTDMKQSKKERQMKTGKNALRPNTSMNGNKGRAKPIEIVIYECLLYTIAYFPGFVLAIPKTPFRSGLNVHLFILHLCVAWFLYDLRVSEHISWASLYDVANSMFA